MTVLYRMKDENFVICLLFILLLDRTTSALYLSQMRATKLINETFVVICKDDAGQTVTWKGPKGQLGIKTQPQVIQASFGTPLIFNATKAGDNGTYTCSSPTETKEFHLMIEEDRNTYKPNIDRTVNTINNHNYHIYNNHKKNDVVHKYNNENKHNTNVHAIDSHEDEAPLTFMDTPSEQIGKEGENVNLRCEVKGGQVTWSVEGEDQLDPRYEIIGDGLLIRNVSRIDSKTFLCKAVQQSTGTMLDKKIRLIVEHKPSLPSHYPVYAKQEQAWGYIGGIVNLTCEVEAEPAPKFEWKYKDNKKRVGRVLNVTSHISVLQLIVTKSTLGNYQCIAENRLGKLQKHFSLEKGTKPSPPDFLELRGANSDLLDLGIHGPEITEEEEAMGMTPKWYNVEYKTVDSETWESQEFNRTEENSYPLRNLQHETEYEIRAASRNVAGLSSYTNSSIFKTLPSTADSVHIIHSTVSYIFIATIISMILSNR